MVVQSAWALVAKPLIKFFQNKYVSFSNNGAKQYNVYDMDMDTVGL